MKTLERVIKSKKTAPVVDKSLERYKGKVLAPEKLAKANEVLAKSGLPSLKKGKN